MSDALGRSLVKILSGSQFSPFPGGVRHTMVQRLLLPLRLPTFGDIFHCEQQQMVPRLFVGTHDAPGLEQHCFHANVWETMGNLEVMEGVLAGQDLF